MGRKVPSEVAVKLMRSNNLEPLCAYPGAAKPWRVKCLICGTKGTPTYAHVKNRGGGCKECGRIKTANAKRIDPNKAAKLMRQKGYEPLEPFHEGKSPWPAIHLACGTLVTPRYTNIASGQGGCYTCGKIEAAKKRLLNGDRCTRELIELGFRPLEEYRGVKKRWKCSCLECNSEFTTSLENARKGAQPLCVTCNRARMGKKRRIPTHIAFNDMKKIGLIPIGEFPGVHKKWKAMCSICNSSTSLNFTSAQLRISKNPISPLQGCEQCVFHQVGKSRLFDQIEVENRLLKLNMKPLGVYLGSTEPIHAICLKCGDENQVLISKALGRGRACRRCSIKHRSDKSRKPQAVAVEQMLAAGFKPIGPYINFNSPWKSIHLACGNEVSPSLGSIRKQSGCSFCAKYGFDSASPAILYILENPTFEAVKIGITGVSTTRIQRLIQRHGWVIKKKFSFKSGSDARLIEKIVLSWWRHDLEAPVALRPKDSGSLGGWTETAPLTHVSVDVTIQYVENLRVQHRRST